MNEPIEFTPREKILINYYRDRQLSGGSRMVARDIGFIAVPLVCVGLFWHGGDSAWIFAGYALLLYRIGQVLRSSIVYSSTFSDIFDKYEARLKELESERKPAD